MAKESTYEIMGQKGKSVSAAELSQLALRGEIDGETLIREKGTQRWVRPQFGPQARPVDGGEPPRFDGDPPPFVALDKGIPEPTTRSPQARPLRTPTDPQPTEPVLQVPESAALEKTEDVQAAPVPSVRFSWKFLLVTLVVIGLIVGGIFTVQHLVAPTPVDRFIRFAEAVKKELIEQGVEPEQFHKSFRYSVRRSDWDIPSHEAMIHFGAMSSFVIYRFEYRDNRWRCIEGVIQGKNDQQQVVTSVMIGIDLETQAFGPNMAKCSKY